MSGVTVMLYSQEFEYVEVKTRRPSQSKENPMQHCKFLSKFSVIKSNSGVLLQKFTRTSYSNVTEITAQIPVYECIISLASL